MALYHVEVKSLNSVFFFIIHDFVNQGKVLFYLKALLGNNFPQFNKSPDKYTSKTRQVETKPVSK